MERDNVTSEFAGRIDIAESAQQLLNQKERVIPGFYERLFRRDPAIRRYFTNVNLHQQATLLTMALITVESHYTNSCPATDHYLNVLGYRHHLDGIDRADFTTFRDCLLETLAEFHQDDWSPQLAGQWRAALDRAIETMLLGYDREFVY